jgi:hypothetical protein
MCQKALKSNLDSTRSIPPRLAYYRLERYPEALEEFETVLKLNLRMNRPENSRSHPPEASEAEEIAC